MTSWLAVLLLGLVSTSCYLVTNTDDISGAVPAGASGEQASSSGGGGSNGGPCADDARNGDESDVDCGGATCPPCANDRACDDASDCDSGHCATGQCAPWAVAIAAGVGHTCALTTTGAIRCWGANNAGQLGDGSQGGGSQVPVRVAGLPDGIVAVSAGLWHTCASNTTGNVWCWGADNTGQLGNGDMISSPLPVDVSGLSAGVVAISAGGHHACALLASGAVACSGRGEDGALGNDSTANSSIPVPVEGLTTGVAAISAGYRHTCAMSATGGVVCWGLNSSGQLGNDLAGTALTPVPVDDALSGVAAVSAGGGSDIMPSHTCILTTSKGVRCWGGGGKGQLGNGVLTGSSVAAVDVSGLSSGAEQVAAGGEHTCALTTSGGVRCWGSNEAGQLGDGSGISRPEPVTVLVP